MKKKLFLILGTVFLALLIIVLILLHSYNPRAQLKSCTATSAIIALGAGAAVGEFD